MLSIIKLCRFILFIATFWKFTTRVFISIFWFSNIRHGPQEELARLSYRWERKVKILKNSPILGVVSNLWFKYSDFRKVIPQKSDDFGVFFHKNPLYMSRTGLVLVKKVGVHNFLDSFVVHAIMKFYRFTSVSGTFCKFTTCYFLVWKVLKYQI